MAGRRSRPMPVKNFLWERRMSSQRALFFSFMISIERKYITKSYRFSTKGIRFIYKSFVVDLAHRAHQRYEYPPCRTYV